MERLVDRTCRQVIDNPSIFPSDVRAAASRLNHFFGDRRFGSIGREDLRAYVKKSTGGNAGIDAKRINDSAGMARFDLNILGTLAGFAEEIALWELIRTWIDEDLAANAEAQA